MLGICSSGKSDGAGVLGPNWPRLSLTGICFAPPDTGVRGVSLARVRERMLVGSERFRVVGSRGRTAPHELQR